MAKVAAPCSSNSLDCVSGPAAPLRPAPMGRARNCVSIALASAVALAACNGNIGSATTGSAGGSSPAGTGATTGVGGAAPPAGTGGSTTGTGGSGQAGGTAGTGGTGGAPVVLDCSAIAPGPVAACGA